MATTRLTDVIVPVEFTKYVVQNTMEKSALAQSGVAARNGVIEAQLSAGADSFTIPNWFDLGNEEANIVNDDPAVLSVPNKITSGKQLVRKSFLHNSWSAMNLASELSGDDALARIRSRTAAYWERQMQRRLIASLNGVIADNVANDASDMVLDISALVGDAAKFGATAVIDATAELGDNLSAVTAVAMHSDIYRAALKADLIEFIPQSQGASIRMYRGLAVIVDDGLPSADGNYTTALLGPGAVGWGFTEPRIAEGTEIENLPSAGNGGGQQILHSRANLAIHPAGFTWQEAAVAGESPTIAELALAVNWNRVFERKAIPLAFLISKA